jgi:anti-sigma factor ChrR (cupin superfamily)
MASMVSSVDPLIITDLFSSARLDQIPWKPFRKGIEIHRFYGEPPGPSAALLRYTAGASLTRHEHPGYEHIFVLRGSQVDDAGEHHAGTLLIYPPGTHHAVTSPCGCVVLATWEKAVMAPA